MERVEKIEKCTVEVIASALEPAVGIELFIEFVSIHVRLEATFDEFRSGAM